MKKNKKKIFEVILKQYKVFYVEANDREEVLESCFVEDEARSSFGDFHWETDDTDINEVDELQTKYWPPDRFEEVVKLNKDGERIKKVNKYE